MGERGFCGAGKGFDDAVGDAEYSRGKRFGVGGPGDVERCFLGIAFVGLRGMGCGVFRYCRGGAVRDEIRVGGNVEN